MMATALISSALLGLFCFVYWCCRAAWRGDAITDGEEYE